MGKNKLSKELGISKDKAEILLNQYNSRVPFVKKLAEAVTQSASTYKALNRLIQGSAADQAKQAMIDCYNAGFMPMLQIHDELCFSIYNDDDIMKIKQEMENSIEDLRVPFKVDVAKGLSWGETHDNDG